MPYGRIIRFFRGHKIRGSKVQGTQRHGTKKKVVNLVRLSLWTLKMLNWTKFLVLVGIGSRHLKGDRIRISKFWQDPRKKSGSPTLVSIPVILKQYTLPVLVLFLINQTSTYWVESYGYSTPKLSWLPVVLYGYILYPYVLIQSWLALPLSTLTRKKILSWIYV
jgi:hypothetical protein